MSPNKNTQEKIPYVAFSKAGAQQVSLTYNCPGKDSSCSYSLEIVTRICNSLQVLP